MSWQMNWDDLKIIDAAARMRSLSGAARSLHLSQPQLSRRLRQFEDSVGARLFDRTPQGLRPTLAGERLIPLAAAMREAADAVLRAAPELARDAMGVVRIAVDEVREQFLTAHLPSLIDALPGVELEIISAQIHANHAARETEIQIRTCLPESETLVVRRLGQLAYAPFAARAYVEATPQALDARRFAECAWIGLAPDRLWYPEQERWLGARLVRRPQLRVNTMTAAVSAVAAGAGIALLPVFMGRARADLVQLAPTEPALTASENLIVHRDLLREPAVRRAVDALAALYARERATLVGSDEQAVAAE